MDNNLYTGQLSVTDQVYNQIMTMIAESVLKEGDKLPSETELCRLFSVSRVSVRAAIQRLKGQGFIITRHSIGSFVCAQPQKQILGMPPLSDITGEDYLQLFEFRQAIEMQAIDLFAQRATDENRNELRQAMQKMAESTDNITDFTRWDIAFHEAIFKGAHNKYLYNAFLAYKDVFFHYLEETNRLSYLELQGSASNHRFLCEKLLKGEAEAVKKRLMADNSHFYTTVFKYIT